MHEYRTACSLDATPEEAFSWHMRPGALERLTPDWADATVVERTGRIQDGGQVVLRLRRGPASFRWVLKHTAFEDGVLFRDEQVEGPFGSWVHTHRFSAQGSGCLIEDEVIWEAPLGVAGSLFPASLIENELDRLFRFRHARLRNDFARQRRYGIGPGLRVGVTGSSGLLGTALTHLLTTQGHQVIPFLRTRPPQGAEAAFWNPHTGEIDAHLLEGLDAIVHLAGESIAGSRWTPEQKHRILESRVQGTQCISRAMASLRTPPPVLVSASAVGYYGDRGNEILDESASPGKGFLAKVVREWEGATLPAERAGVRVVKLRLGMILSADGGALGKMLLPFKAGVGGRLGSGRQYVSWIDMDDAVGLILHAIRTPDLSGPLNATAPYPVPNATFTSTLGRVLHRPTMIPVPGFAVKAMFGEMGTALLLEGCRVHPSKAEKTGFMFLYPALEESLRFQLGKDEDSAD